MNERLCICADPENCTERVPGYRCKKDFMPRTPPSSNLRLGMDTPWPLPDVLAKLIEATEHLLDAHGCDAHGYEEFRTAAKRGKEYLATLNATDETPAQSCGPNTPWDRLCGEPSCAYCGAQKTVSPHPEPWTCPKCQQLNSAGSSTCGRCEDT